MKLAHDNTKEVAPGCSNCGCPMPQDAAFCPHCGHARPLAQESAELTKCTKARRCLWEKIERLAGGSLSECTNDLVAFEVMTASGLARDERGRWSRTLMFGDTAYDQERREQRDDIYDKMCQFHSVFPAGSAYQINLLNMPETRDAQAAAAQLLPTDGADADMARHYNGLIKRKQAEGRTEIRRINLVTFSIQAEDEQAAENLLATMRENAAAHLGRMQVRAESLDGDARMRIFHDLLRGPESPYTFSYASLGARERARASVAPDFAAYPDVDATLRRTILTPNFYVKTLHIADFGSELSDAAIRRIRALPVPMNISLTFFPQPKGEIIRKVQQNINAVQGEIVTLQSKMSRQGMDPTILPPAMEDKEADGKELRSFLIEDDQQVSWFQGLITIYAKTPADMRRYTSMILDEAQVFSLSVAQVPLYQEELWKSSQPVADTFVPDKMRSLTTAESAIMMPWTSESVFHDPRNSYFFVQHATTLAPLFISPDELGSPHTMVFGMTGYGKGMLLNTIIGHLVASWPRTETDDGDDWARCPDPAAPQVFVFDQHAEYTPLANALSAPIYKFSPNGRWRLNPFDLNCREGELTMAEVSRNADFFKALAQDVLDGALTKRHEAVVDRCLRIVFQPHLGKTTRPVLSDFAEALRQQPETEAVDIALAFESFIDGLANSFNGQTNVRDAPHLTIYDCSELGKSLEVMAMLSMLQHVRNACFRNNAAGKPTYLIMEEVQILLENEPAARMLNDFYAQMRKWGLHMVCVTQHPITMLEHPIGKKMYENTGMHVFLPMQNLNAEYVAEYFKLSPTQKDMIDVRGDNKGRGLVSAAGMKIPFNAWIDPKWDKELYETFNTDPNARKRVLEAVAATAPEEEGAEAREGR